MPEIYDVTTELFHKICFVTLIKKKHDSTLQTALRNNKKHAMEILKKVKIKKHRKSIFCIFVLLSMQGTRISQILKKFSIKIEKALIFFSLIIFSLWIRKVINEED